MTPSACWRVSVNKVFTNLKKQKIKRLLHLDMHYSILMYKIRSSWKPLYCDWSGPVNTIFKCLNVKRWNKKFKNLKVILKVYVLYDSQMMPYQNTCFMN